MPLALPGVYWVKDNDGVVPENEHENFTRTLHHQSEIWPRLLCGEKLVIDLLSADNYKKAGDRFAKCFLGLIGSFVVSWWYVIVPFAVIIGGIVYAILKYVPSGASTVTAFIARAAGSLGVSWKTLASTLGRVATNAENRCGTRR